MALKLSKNHKTFYINSQHIDTAPEKDDKNAQYENLEIIIVKSPDGCYGKRRRRKKERQKEALMTFGS